MHDPKAKSIRHPYDYLYCRIKTADHEPRGFGHPNLGTFHCRNCGVHLGTHWAHADDRESTFQSERKQDLSFEGL